MTRLARAESIEAEGFITTVVIATLPPPTTGMTRVTNRVVEELSLRGRVHVINLSAGGAARRRNWKAIRSIRQMSAALNVLLGRAGQGNIYIALNSGTAVLLDVLLVASARARRRQVFIHHHSFRYVDAPSPLLRTLYQVGGNNVVDIVLCTRMADSLNRAYGRTNARVVPNPVEIEVSDTSRERNWKAVRLGHLSNLSLEKGVGRAIESFGCARSNGIDVELHFAGPYASEDARKAVEGAMAAWPDSVFYYGRLDGKDKDSFYRSLDLFLYPTDYVVEAQPLVLLEALAAGVPVVTIDRGCIAGLADLSIGKSVRLCSLESFSEEVEQVALEISKAGSSQQTKDRLNAEDTANTFAAQGRPALTALVEEIMTAPSRSTRSTKVPD